MAATAVSAHADPPAPASLCQARTPSTPLWPAETTIAHGTHEFTTTSLIVVPAGVTSVTVELWGAGGGGGGGATETYSEGGSGGGGGASGAYGRIVASVRPGATLLLVVGRGGSGGAVASAASGTGQGGGATALCDGTNPIAFVEGGRGGSAGSSSTSRRRGG